MTEVSIPQQGTTVGDATQAPYSADEFALYMSKQIGLGAMRADLGVVRGSGDTPAGTNILKFGLDVSQNGVNRSVRVYPGTAMVKGTMYENTSELVLSIGANSSGNPRIDTVVLRKDYAAQTVRLVVLQGTAAASPVRPTLTQSDGVLWEIPLADIPVPNGATSFDAFDFTFYDGFVNDPDRVVLDNVLNSSGGELISGDVVLLKTNTNSVQVATTTTTVNHANVGGVWVGVTANGEYGRVLVHGMGYVNLGTGGGGTTAGILVTENAAKQARAVTPNGGLYYTLGWILENGSVNGDCVLAYINPRPIGIDYVRIIDTKAQNTAGGGFTNGAWRTRDLNSLQYDTPFSDTVSLAANVFTLSKIGFYVIRASAPAYNVDGHQVRLNNNTGGTTFEGTSEYAPTGIQTRSFVEARFALTAAAAFTLEHRCITTKATDGFGRQVNLAAEQYSVVEIWHTPMPHVGS